MIFGVKLGYGWFLFSVISLKHFKIIDRYQFIKNNDIQSMICGLQILIVFNSCKLKKKSVNYEIII